MSQQPDTIAAVATPPGRGGIGVIRVSGPSVKRIAEAVVGGVVACPGCARDLEVHEHHSPVMGSFLASAVGGDE